MLLKSSAACQNHFQSRLSETSLFTHHCKIQLEFKLRTGQFDIMFWNSHKLKKCTNTITLTQCKCLLCESIKYWDFIMHWISWRDTVWYNFRNLCRNLVQNQMLCLVSKTAVYWSLDVCVSWSTVYRKW